MTDLRFEFHTAETVKSTNTTVKELAKNGAPEGYVLSASAQTRGRGRLNRIFFSPTAFPAESNGSTMST